MKVDESEKKTLKPSMHTFTRVASYANVCIIPDGTSEEEGSDF